MADSIYQIFKIILNMLKKYGEKTNNPSLNIYVKKQKKGLHLK